MESWPGSQDARRLRKLDHGHARTYGTSRTDREAFGSRDQIGKKCPLSVSV